MRHRLLVAAGVTTILSTSAHGGTVTLPTVADAAIYEDEAGVTANSLGQYLFVGQSEFITSNFRRSLLRFDFSTIPAGSTIDSVSLTLRLSRTISGDSTVFLHRVTSAWNEGTSAAIGEEGAGAAAEPGDPTWLFSSFSSTPWTTAGGDFVAAPSASQTVGLIFPALFTWSGPGMVADVQAWLDSTQPNHGWILLGNEAVEGSAKRFDSRENMVIGGAPPSLVVEFTPPPNCPGDANGDSMVTFADITFILSMFGNPFTFGDITVTLSNFGVMCRP